LLVFKHIKLKKTKILGNKEKLKSKLSKYVKNLQAKLKTHI